MPQADPLEVSGAGIVLPMLESLQGQLIAIQKLLTLLRDKGDETVSSEVAEHLVQVEDHLKEAVRCLHTPLPQTTWEVSPTIPWMAASPSEGSQKSGARITLRERGDILSRAIQARRLNSGAAISAEHDPVTSQLHED